MSENKGNEGHKTSFWKLLKKYRVEVPIIQRDYAQGRVGKEFLRTKFLEDLKKALDNKVELVLDFVYGSQEGATIRPLDGQQRLTTLWLLHWYIAYRAEKINTCAYTQEEIDGESVAERRDEMGKTTVADILKRFTYETRISSREFCERLASFDKKLPIDVGIVNHIKNQSWFFSAWEQDPTIQSMLRMLGGTEGDDDGIERVFEGVNYGTFWEKLTSKEPAPVVFYYLPLENFGLSDDLYVKMNARGKPLTPFENFKADLIGYLSKRALGEDDKLSEGEREEWIRLYETIPAKLDNAWTDIFWENKSDGNKIDEIYYAFLNRFFWNELFIAKTNNEYVLRFSKGSKLESPNSSFEYLDEDSVDEYLGIERYEFLDGRIPTKLFKDLRIVLDRYKAYMDLYKKLREDGENPLSDLVSKEEWNSIPFPDIFFPKWIRGDFEFIPKYKEENGVTKISTLTQVQRCIFFALCKYFKEEKIKGEDTTQSPPKESFVALKQWMRVVCNLVSGKYLSGAHYIRDYPTVRNALEYISKLEVSKDPHDVYEHLAKMKTTSGEEKKELSALDRQWNEEIIKARQIRKDEKWERIIIEAEEYAFFEGTIRFLYQGEDGKEEDWGNFNKKWENVSELYFTEGTSFLRNQGAITLRLLIKQFEKPDFEKVLIWGEEGEKKRDAEDNKNKMILGNGVAAWRSYLINPRLSAPVHKFLTINDITDTIKEMEGQLCPRKEDGVIKYALYLLTETELLDRVIEVFAESGLRYEYDKYKQRHLVVRKFGSSEFTRGKQFVLLNTSKYDFLENRDVTKREESYEIEGTKLHFEFANICFHYGSYNFILYRDDNLIYLQPKDPKGWEGVLEEGTDTEYHFEKTIDDVAADWVNAKGEEKEEKIKNFLSELEKLGDKARAAGHDEVYDPPSNS